MPIIETLSAIRFIVLASVFRESTMLLPEAFAVASISGLWLPRHWQSSFSLRTLYRAYTCFTVAAMLLIIVSQLVALIFLTRSVEELVEAAFLFLSAVNSSVKCVNMLLRRQRIVELLDMFADETCTPRNDEEWKIRSSYDKVARYMTLSTLLLAGTSAGSLGVWPLLLPRDNNCVQSMRAWQPYEITNALRYYITQTHQMIALMTIMLWNAASDYICPGFMIQMCAQLQLMYRRLTCLPEDTARQSQLVKESVQHHLHIFEMSERLATVFTPAILSQYLLSGFVLCISVYQMTTNRSNIVQMMIVFVYVSAMAVELLIYCWHGNEVSQTSLLFSKMICELDWIKLDVNNRKSLLIMMLRSSLPIRITCGPLITLSNESYARILKLSYSVFNLLQRTQ